MLDPVGAVVARHDQADRIAVEHRQVSAVHGPGDHHLAVARVVDVQRLDEVRAVGIGQRRVVEPVEHDLHAAGPHAGPIEHLPERHARPARIAHRPVRQLPTADARLEIAPSVARALIDGDDLARLAKCSQLAQRQIERGVDVAAHLQPVGRRIDRGGDAAPVVAHEERVIGRDEAFVEHRKRCLQLRRPAGLQDQRTLLRKDDELALAVVERQGDAACGGGQRRQCGVAQGGAGTERAQRLEDAAPGGASRRIGGNHAVVSLVAAYKLSKDMATAMSIRRAYLRASIAMRSASPVSTEPIR